MVASGLRRIYLAKRRCVGKHCRRWGVGGLPWCERHIKGVRKPWEYVRCACQVEGCCHAACASRKSARVEGSWRYCFWHRLWKLRKRAREDGWGLTSEWGGAIMKTGEEYERDLRARKQRHSDGVRRAFALRRKYGERMEEVWQGPEGVRVSWRRRRVVDDRLGVKLRKVLSG
jgi:hypothetical protein